MLAVSGEPFDSDDHLYEIKWDGIRAVALVDRGGLRLWSRNEQSLASRFPELAELAALPAGLALDGEIVALRDGVPDFARVLRRARGAGVAGKSRTDGEAAVTFVAFDILYRGYEPLMQLPLRQRRAHLGEVLASAASRRVVFSEGVEGRGLALFEQACSRGLEGVMAKRLESTYTPGRRSGAWVKIKRRQRAVCAIIGYLEKPVRDFQCLLVATNQLPGEEPGPLRYVGRVGGGFSDAMRARMNDMLRAHPSATPIVACPERARWIEAGLYCAVSFAELTEAGLLRAPVFEELVEA